MEQASGKIAKIGILTVLSLFLLLLANLCFLAVPSVFWSVLSFLLFGGYLCGLAVISPVSFMLLLPYIFFRLTVLVSGIAIENGGYMEDLEIMGEASGAYIRLCGVYIVFISFAACVIEWCLKYCLSKNYNLDHLKERTQRHPWVWIFFGIFTAFSIYVLAVGLFKGFQLLTNVDRFKFRDEIGGRAFLLYMGNRFIAALLFGAIIYLCRGLRRNMAIFLFALMIVVSVLFGEKFTSLILMFIYVATPAYLMSRYLQRRILWHMLPSMAAAACLTLPIILMVYGWAERPHDAIDLLSVRMVGQGELWYVADRDTGEAFRFDQEQLVHILQASVIQEGNDIARESPFMGVYYFMNQYMPPGMLAFWLQRPSLTLTFGFEPYLLVVFGWIGMIVPLCFYAGIYALSLSYLAWSIFNARPISIFIAAKILIWIITGLAQGYLFMIFGFKLFLMALAAILYEVVSDILSRKRNGRFA